jgi:hypothetical protein
MKEHARKRPTPWFQADREPQNGDNTNQDWRHSRVNTLFCDSTRSWEDQQWFWEQLHQDLAYPR